jgi:hypothetical protein
MVISLKIILEVNTCKISHKDQQKQLPKRRRQPRNQLSPPEPKTAFAGNINSALSSFGPLSNAMDTAPPTHKIVPAIFAILLKLPRSILSNLMIKSRNINMSKLWKQIIRPSYQPTY